MIYELPISSGLLILRYTYTMIINRERGINVKHFDVPWKASGSLAADGVTLTAYVHNAPVGNNAQCFEECQEKKIDYVMRNLDKNVTFSWVSVQFSYTQVAYTHVSQDTNNEWTCIYKYGLGILDVTATLGLGLVYS